MVDRPCVCGDTIDSGASTAGCGSGHDQAQKDHQQREPMAAVLVCTMKPCLPPAASPDRGNDIEPVHCRAPHGRLGLGIAAPSLPDCASGRSPDTPDGGPISTPDSVTPRRVMRVCSPFRGSEKGGTRCERHSGPRRPSITLVQQHVRSMAGGARHAPRMPPEKLMIWRENTVGSPRGRARRPRLGAGDALHLDAEHDSRRVICGATAK